MRVRYVKIRNFRGIQSLDWSLSARFVVLIGAGDSGKSTILDALALALSPSWRPPLNDADFYACDFSKPVVIEVTLSDLPDALLREDRLGLWLRGIAPDGVIGDEPDTGDEAALTIRLTINEALDPEWEVVRDAAGMHISGRDRARFGVFRLGDAAATHLRWSRESALSHLGETGEVGEMLVAAQRAARNTVFENPSPGLKDGAKAAGEAVSAFGGAYLEDPRAGLDPAAGLRSGSLVLHDGDIPATGLGLGSQRLAGIAFQLRALDSQSVALIDEVEIGLEPHRLLHVIGQLRARANEGTGQVILATHSPIVVEGVDATDLHVVRRQSTATEIRRVPPAIKGLGGDEPQATTRSGASAMLARRIVVCEGATELGVCRALLEHWDSIEKYPAALLGTAYRDGGGTQAPTRARCLAELGYTVALLVDSDIYAADKELHDQHVAEAEQLGVTVLRWEDGKAIEDQTVACLPVARVRELVAIAIEIKESEAAICDAVAAQLGKPSGLLQGQDPIEWVRQSGEDGPTVRAAIGRAARNGQGWFKNQGRGYRLGELIVSSLPELSADNHLRQTLDALREFTYADVGGDSTEQ